MTYNLPHRPDYETTKLAWRFFGSLAFSTIRPGYRIIVFIINPFIMVFLVRYLYKLYKSNLEKIIFTVVFSVTDQGCVTESSLNNPEIQMILPEKKINWIQSTHKWSKMTSENLPSFIFLWQRLSCCPDIIVPNKRKYVLILWYSIS